MQETRPKVTGDEVEEHLLKQMREGIIAKSALFSYADGLVKTEGGRPMLAQNPGKVFLMGEDPRLPRMPAKPTLMDFYRYRMEPYAAAHLLQSAAHARKAGLPEKTVAACLLHDIAMGCFIRGDHGYWGAQLVAPYVDEEISWAIRAHQALRFYPDSSVGYEYPESYKLYFGEDYVPDDYIQAEYENALKHKWYLTARMITCFDIYSFDQSVTIDVEEFEDIFARNFRQPADGLGYDDTPVSHMWRTIIRPTKYA